ncbi:MAG: DUF624 domain-containing protein [Brevefilum sp.]
MPAEPSKDKEHIFPETELLKIREPKSFKDRLMNVYYDSLPLFNVNVAWFLLSLPIVSVLPALGGLYYAVLNYNQNKNANWNIFWEGIKKHWLLSLKWAAVVLFGNLLITLNIWFSLNIDTTWSIYTLLFGLMLGIFWISINQFSFPILLLQKEKKIFLAIRNAYVIVLRRPWDAIKVILLNLLITIVSLLIPPFWIFITMSLIVHIQTRSVLKAVKRIQSQDDDPDTNISES